MNTLKNATGAYSIIKPKIVACRATSALHEAFTSLPVRARPARLLGLLHLALLARLARHSLGQEQESLHSAQQAPRLEPLNLEQARPEPFA